MGRSVPPSCLFVAKCCFTALRSQVKSCLETGSNTVALASIQGDRGSDWSPQSSRRGVTSTHSSLGSWEKGLHAPHGYWQGIFRESFAKWPRLQYSLLWDVLVQGVTIQRNRASCHLRDCPGEDSVYSRSAACRLCLRCFPEEEEQKSLFN